MWPKMLFELLPHFARLVPMAEKFFATRGQTENAHEAALAALGDGVRTEIGQIAEAHEGIQRRLQEQGIQLGEVAVEVTRARLGVETLEARVAKLEKTASGLMTLLVLALVLMVGALGMLGVVLMHQGAR